MQFYYGLLLYLDVLPRIRYAAVSQVNRCTRLSIYDILYTRKNFNDMNTKQLFAQQTSQSGLGIAL